MTRIQRLLALAHLGSGLLLLLGVAWAWAVVLGVLPSSTGVYVLVVLNPGFAILGPLLASLAKSALGVWMLILARWLWNGHARLRSALFVTHGLLLLVGSLFIVFGFLAVAAAERSTARGGGLMSPVAFLPFLYGLPLVSFALWSILVALVRIPKHRRILRGGDAAVGGRARRATVGGRRIG
jgi:hypothetical protein